MANNTLIQIKRSSSVAAPLTLGAGELAISSVSNVLFVGLPDGSSTVAAIGGVRYPGTLTANQALVANSTLGIDRVITANLSAQQIYANGAVGTAGYVLASGAAANLYWVNPSTFTSSAAGANTQVQFNNSTAFGASAGFTFNSDSNVLSVSNSISIGGTTLNSTAFNGSANNSTYIGGYTLGAPPVIGGSTANGISLTYANVSGQVNTTTFFATTTANVGVVGTNAVAITTTTINIGNATINATINSTAFTGAANNASYLGGTAAASFVQNTDSRTLSGNLALTGANLNIQGTNTYITSNVTVTSANIDATSALLRVRDIIASGNLTINGTLTAIDTNTLQVKDNFIKIADQNGLAVTDAVDFGFYGVANIASITTYFGIGRIAGASNTFTVFTTTTEPATAGALIGTTIGTLKSYLSSGALTSNSTAVAITANSTVSVNLTANSLSLSNALPVGSGGTGLNTVTAGALLYGNSTSNLVALSVGSNGQILQVINMDGAYINVFIEKLRNTINDMQSKILLLETDLHFRDLKAAELATQVSDLQTSLDKVSKKAKKVEDNTF